MRAAQIEGSKSRGDRTLTIREAANKLGIKDTRGIEGAVKDRSGGSTLEGMMAFIQALGEGNKTSRVPLSGPESQGLIGAYGQLGDPIFGKNGGDLLSAIKGGESPKAAISRLAKERDGHWNNDAYNEIWLRNQESRAELAVEEGSRTDGDKSRSYNAQNKESNARREHGPLGDFTYRRVPDFMQQFMDESSGAWKFGENKPAGQMHDNYGVIDTAAHSFFGQFVGLGAPGSASMTERTSPGAMVEAVRANAAAMQEKTAADRQLISRPNGKTEAP
jgi:hypothetical protein